MVTAATRSCCSGAATNRFGWGKLLTALSDRGERLDVLCSVQIGSVLLEWQGPYLMEMLRRNLGFGSPHGVKARSGILCLVCAFLR